MPFLPHVPSTTVTTIRSSRKARQVLVAGGGPARPRFAAADVAGHRKAARVPFRRLHNRAAGAAADAKSGGKGGKGGKDPGHVRLAKAADAAKTAKTVAKIVAKTTAVAAAPPPPCSPEARLKSPTRMPLPPAPGPSSPPQFSSLPDPFAELEAVELGERIEKKNELGPTTIARISRLRQRIRCRGAVLQWKAVMLVQRHDARLAQAELLRTRSAGCKIVRAWRDRLRRDAGAKQAAASLVLARHHLQIVVGLRVWQRRVQAKTLRTFVKNHTMPRFCQMIHLLRFKAIKIQRCFRDYLAISKARVRVLKMRFDKRVVERCDAIRAENHQRVLDYEEEKIRLMHVELQKTEDKWHESHARVRSIIVKAASAASRAKRRRRATRIAGLEGDGGQAATAAVAVAAANIVTGARSSNKHIKRGGKASRKANTPAAVEKKENLSVRMQKHKQRNDAVLQAEAKHLVDSIVLRATQSPRKQQQQGGTTLAPVAETDPVAGVGVPVLDALALQFMHLPSDVKKQLLKGILKRRRRHWARRQDEARRKHSNQVETHRAINVQDIKDLISGKLQVSGLEKQTLVRFEFEPLKMYSQGITVDLDRAIDNACTYCVWDF
jgi:hypothetical protein